MSRTVQPNELESIQAYDFLFRGFSREGSPEEDLVKVCSNCGIELESFEDGVCDDCYNSTVLHRKEMPC
ncbi:MAG: hypothetical protein ABIH92_01045 [Nanoarchaeota archaeon]